MILAGSWWRGPLCHRFAYGIAGAVTAIVSIEIVLYLYAVTGLEPPSRHEPSIDMLRRVGTVVGLSFWLPA